MPTSSRLQRTPGESCRIDGLLPGWEGGAEPLTDGVDHVYVPMLDASAAFAVLVEQLRLPLLWPFTSFGEFSSGGVSVGSIKLEVIEANAAAPWCLAHDPPQIQGVAFRPARPVDDAYLAKLDERSIARTEPARFMRDGKPTWTNVYFSDTISAVAGAFVCDYHTPEPRDIERRRRVLAECDGGRLGVLDATELVVGSRDLTAASARWQRFFDPLQPVEPYTWRPPVGPAIRLTTSEQEAVSHLTLAVRSPETAEEVWCEVAEGPLCGFPLRFVAGHQIG